MHSLGDLSKALHRPAVYVSGLQARFELPVVAGAAYPAAYLEFLRNIVALRSLNISEETLRELWRLEKKLLALLHVDSRGSKTWFLDACGQTTHRRRRLLLSNYDLGMDLSAPGLQLGLDFAQRPPELFGGEQMGEDALRVLRNCLKLQTRIHAEITAELPHLRAALRWAGRITGG